MPGGFEEEQKEADVDLHVSPEGPENEPSRRIDYSFGGCEERSSRVGNGHPLAGGRQREMHTLCLYTGMGRPVKMGSNHFV